MTPTTQQILLDAVVTMDLVDLHSVSVKYMRAAELAHTLVRRELGTLSMREFQGPVESLFCTAENIFFESHGHFADLEGTGIPMLAAEFTGCLLADLRHRATH